MKSKKTGSLRRYSRTRKIWPLEIWMWALCLFLLTTPFSFILTGTDPQVSVARDFASVRGVENSNAAIYAIRAGVLAIALVVCLLSVRKTFLNAFGAAGAFVLFLCWSGLSVLWTEQFKTSVNAVFSLALMMAASSLISLRLPPVLLARSLLYSAVIMATATAAFAVGIPYYGVHQLGDAAQSVHAGAWRGVYMHKNHLGQLSASLACATLFAGYPILRTLRHKYSIFLLLLIVIGMTRSSSALAVLIMTPIIVWAIVHTNIVQKAVLASVFGSLVLVVFAAAEFLLSSVGRDITFSGRTLIWDVAWQSIVERPLFGWGYMSPTYGDFTYNMLVTMGITDPHNMYFDTWLGLGLAGLSLLTLAAVASLSCARRLVRRSRPDRATAGVFAAIVVSWLLCGLTESASRPMSAVFGIALCAMIGLNRAGRLSRTGLGNEKLDLIGMKQPHILQAESNLARINPIERT